jgi:hypothetical protein
LKERLTKKAGKQSDEGRIIDALLEIRVDADPGWDADFVAVQFWFLRPEDAELGKLPTDWSSWLQAWLALVAPGGRFRTSGTALPLSRMTALEYCRSQRLDLDHLSGPR